MLVLSLYFTAWGKRAKSHAIENKNIKRRVTIALFSISRSSKNCEHFVIEEN